MKVLVAACIAGLALASGPARASGIVQLTKGGTSSPQTSVIGGASIADNEIDQAFADDDDDDLVLFGSGADDGDAAPNSVRALVNRSIATVTGKGRDGRDSRRAVANPQLARSFDGVNFFDQRFSNNGNQFSVEPPDQGLCAGNGFVIESANDVMKIFDTSGNLVVGPVDLNTFYNYPAAINDLSGAVKACGNSTAVDPCAYAMYDLADALVRSGRPQDAIPILQARLQRFDNQNGTVEALLRKAQQEAGSGGAAGPGKGPGNGKGPKD